jgi:hypothetical protein
MNEYHCNTCQYSQQTSELILICADDNSTCYLQPVPEKACKLFYSYEPGTDAK